MGEQKNSSDGEYIWIILGCLGVISFILVILVRHYITKKTAPTKKATTQKKTVMTTDELLEHFSNPPTTDDIGEAMNKALERIDKAILQNNGKGSLKNNDGNSNQFTNISGLEHYFDLKSNNGFQDTPTSSVTSKVDIRTKLKRHKALLTFIRKKMLAAQENNDDDVYDTLQKTASPIIKNINAILDILNDSRNDYGLDDVIETPDVTTDTPIVDTTPYITQPIPSVPPSTTKKAPDVLKENDPSGVFIHSEDHEGIDTIFVPRMSFL